jgi:hypothetical protein
LIEKTRNFFVKSGFPYFYTFFNYIKYLCILKKCAMPDTIIRSNTDVVLIGAGIMSALGLMLKLQPDIKIEIFERLDIAAAEFDAWNNAGTGHSAFAN